MRRLFTASALALGLVMSATAPAALGAPVETFVKIEKPAEGTPILIIVPEVSLGMLTAGGAVDPKEEWSQNARKYLNDALTKQVAVRKYSTLSADLTAYEDSHDLQMLKLNDIVSDSILLSQFPMFKLPTKTTFDWTLGTGAAQLAPEGVESAPAYALFLRAKGSYSSSGRAVAWLAAAALGVSTPLGGQTMVASLVDLKTGRVVWYQNYIVPAGTDIRTAEGATNAVLGLFKKLPL